MVLEPGDDFLLPAKTDRTLQSGISKPSLSWWKITTHPDWRSKGIVAVEAEIDGVP